VVEKPFVTLMPHKQYNSREQPDKRMRKRSRGCKLLFCHRDGWKKDVSPHYCTTVADWEIDRRVGRL
jgi:hypothetical protein